MELFGSEIEFDTMKENSKNPLKLNKLVQENEIKKEYEGRPDKPFNLFSPSQIGYCRRQMYNRKMNLTEMPRNVQGILHSGTRHHFWLEHHLPRHAEDRGLETEKRLKAELELDEEDFNLYVSGEADAVDTEGYVYDHKFTSNTDYAPKDKDIRQVMMYIYALPEAHTGQLEYVKDGSRFSKDGQYKVVEVEFDREEFIKMVGRMRDVAKKVQERKGTKKELVNPFDKCDCFFCDSEEPKEEVNKALMDLEDGDE